jgi:hypothetical protein
MAGRASSLSTAWTGPTPTIGEGPDGRFQILLMPRDGAPEQIVLGAHLKSITA